MDISYDNGWIMIDGVRDVEIRCYKHYHFIFGHCRTCYSHEALRFVADLIEQKNMVPYDKPVDWQADLVNNQLIEFSYISVYWRKPRLHRSKIAIRVDSEFDFYLDLTKVNFLEAAYYGRDHFTSLLRLAAEILEVITST